MRNFAVLIAVFLVPLFVEWKHINQALASVEIFTDITDEAGIHWKHFNGESEDRLLIEASCGGVGFLDFDNDGLLDIYLVNGGENSQRAEQNPGSQRSLSQPWQWQI